MPLEIARKPLDVVHRWKNLALGMIFPPACALCDRPLDTIEVDPQVCQTCEAEVFQTSDTSCIRCGAYGMRKTTDGAACLECKDAKLAFCRTHSLGPYQGQLQAAIVQMKTAAGESIAAAAGRLLADKVGADDCSNKTELVTCVPKYWLKRLTTGVNGTEVLMSAFGKRAKLPTAADLITCQRKIEKQALLSPQQRRQNVSGAWRVSEHYDIRGTHVLLIDDTMTTGATANSIAQCLRRAGAAKVELAVVARAQKKQ